MNWEKRLAPIILRSSDPEISKSKILQNFSLPKTFVYYISKNVDSPKLYRKLAKTCKYFPENSHFFFLHCLMYKKEYGGFYTCPYIRDHESCGAYIDNGTAKNRFNINAIPQIIWVENYLVIDCKNNENLLSTLIPRLKCTAKSIHLDNCVITLKEFQKICCYAKSCHLRECSVISENGDKISQPDILNEMPKVLKYSATCVSDVTAAHLKKVIKSAKLNNLEEFSLWGMTETFDIEKGYEYLKKNKYLKVRLTFETFKGNVVSKKYIKKVDEITDEILKDKSRKYYPPYLFCPSRSWNSQSPNGQLESLHENHKVKRNRKNQ